MGLDYSLELTTDLEPARALGLLAARLDLSTRRTCTNGIERRYDPTMQTLRFVAVLPLALVLGACGDDDVVTTATTASTDANTSAGVSTDANTSSGAPTSTDPTGSSDSDTGEPPAGCVVLVDGATGDDASSGSTWASAKRTLGAGLDEAELRAAAGMGPCEVWVAAGTYRPSDTFDPDAGFVLRKDIAVYGGFLGGESAREQRDWLAHETILDGEYGDPADLEDNARHVVIGADGARLDGFTVTGGHARGDMTQRDGGGIHHTDGHLTVARCTIADNRSGDGLDGEFGTAGGSGGFGAGIYVRSGSLTLLDSLITDNRGGDGGEGSAVGGVGGEGAGVLFREGVDLVVRGVAFTNNRSGSGGLGGDVGGPGGGGAGLLVVGATGKVVIDDCDFIGNVGGAGGPSDNLGGPGNGGTVAIYQTDADVIVTRSRVLDNATGAGGTSLMGGSPGGRGGFGGLVFGGNFGAGGAIIANSRFEGNDASFVGGLGILGQAQEPAGPVLVVGCTLAGNTGNDTAGLLVTTNGQRAIMIANTSIAGNDATVRGGGVLFRSEESMGAEPTRLVNSIVWGNTAPMTPNLLAEAAVNVMTPVALALDAVAVEGGCTAGPQLTCGASLAGPPGFVDLAGGDLKLAPNSPLVDAGDDALNPADAADLDGDGDLAEPTPLDLDDQPRRVGGAIDPGAHEVQ